MTIDEALLGQLEALAGIKLDGGQKTVFINELNEIIEYVDTLKKLDAVEESGISSGVSFNTLRQDEATPCESAKDILSGAPESKDGCFAVPKTIQ